MPTDTTQPQPPAPQSSGTSSSYSQPQAPLDSNVVALAQSIRQVESDNNYTATGRSGEYGAYQFMPSTWQAASSSAGVNVPLDQATPEQQNEVAYKTLASWKQQHPDWNLGNYASAWNAGVNNPDAYIDDNVGTNAQGVNYDTPVYATNVGKIYDQIKSGQYTPPTAATLAGTQTPTATSPSAPQKGLWDNLSPWERDAILGVGGAGIVAGSIALGGADIPLLGALGLGAAGADIAGAGIAATVAGGGAVDTGIGAMAAGAGGAAEEAAQPGILSKILSGAESLGAGAGIADTASQILGGGNKGGGGTTDTTTTSAPEVPLPSGGTTNKETFIPAQQTPFTPESYQQSSQATQALMQVQQSFLGNTPTGRVYAQTPEGQNGMAYNAAYGLVGGDDGNGNYTAEEAANKAEDMIDNINQGTGDVLRSEGNSGDNNDALANAKSDAHAHNNPLDYDDIDKELVSLAGQHTRFANERGQIPLDVMNELRKGHGRASRFDIKNPITPAKRAAHKAMYFALRQEIEKKTESKDLFNQAMKEEKGLIDGMKVNKRLNGKRIPIPPSLGKRVAERLSDYAATAIGAKLGGPWGAVVGAVVGHHLDRTIEKKFGKNLLEKKDVQTAMASLAKKRPEVEQLLQDTIKKFTNRQTAEKEYSVIKKEVPKEQQVAEEKEMGTYKTATNPVTGRVNLTGQKREPGVSFYENSIKNRNGKNAQNKKRVNNQKPKTNGQ